MEKTDVYSLLRGVKTIGGSINIATHHDADGIYSVALLKTVLEGPCVVEFPDEFGDVKPSHQFCLDMRPLSPEWKGICFDHHPLHPEKPNYYLFWGETPVGLIIWNLLKDKIPKDRWWLVVGSLVGDGQPELTPPEIWETCPELLMGKQKVYEDKWKKGEYRIYTLPLYKQLSSPVNAACRIDSPLVALSAIMAAKSPFDIVENELLNKAKYSVDVEITKILKEFSTEQVGNILLLFMESDYNIQGYLATTLENSSGKTTLVLNKKNGALSLRGDLASWVAKVLNTIPGVEIAGHAKFMGGKIDLKKVEKTSILKALRTLS